MIFKVRQNDISAEIINVFEDFLSGRNQRVVLNGQHLSLADVCAGTPQRSIL